MSFLPLVHCITRGKSSLTNTGETTIAHTEKLTPMRTCLDSGAWFMFTKQPGDPKYPTIMRLKETNTECCSLTDKLLREVRMRRLLYPSMPSRPRPQEELVLNPTRNKSVSADDAAPGREHLAFMDSAVLLRRPHPHHLADSSERTYVIFLGMPPL